MHADRASRSPATLSIVTRGGEWGEIANDADLLCQYLLLTAEKKFCPLRAVGRITPAVRCCRATPRLRIEALRSVDMSVSNARA